LIAFKMHKGDIVLSKEQTTMSWLVRKVTKSNWSHVGIYNGLGKVISSVPFRGVVYKNYGDMFDVCSNVCVYRVKDLSEEKADEVLKFCDSKQGIKYDFAQAALLGWRIVFNTLETAKSDPNPNNFVCSELVAEAFHSVGIDFGKIPDNVLPGTIEKSPLTRRII